MVVTSRRARGSDRRRRGRARLGARSCGRGLRSRCWSAPLDPAARCARSAPSAAGRRRRSHRLHHAVGVRGDIRAAGADLADHVDWSRAGRSRGTPGPDDGPPGPFRRSAAVGRRDLRVRGSREGRATCDSAPAPAESTHAGRAPSCAAAAEPLGLVRRMGPAGLGGMWASALHDPLERRWADIFATRGCASSSGATRPIAARRPSARRRR